MQNNVIHKKPMTYGLDWILAIIQASIANKLTWNGINNIYGKIQPLIKQLNGIYVTVPSCYDKNLDYISDVFATDSVTSTIAFLVKDHQYDGALSQNNIDVIISVDVQKAFGNQSRDDEKAREQMYWILRHTNWISDISRAKEHNKDVWSGFDTKQIKFADMNPYYTFSLNIQIDYYETALNCPHND